MPKETVTPLCGPYDVKVGWATDRDMQIGVEGSGGRSILWELFPDVEALGAMLRTLPSNCNEVNGHALLNALDGMSHGLYKGLWATLDRQGCNRLIKLIRRARDSAFGRDE